MKRPAESSRWCGHAAIPGQLGHFGSLHSLVCESLNVMALWMSTSLPSLIPDSSLISSSHGCNSWFYCWTHPPRVSSHAHCTVSNIWTANMWTLDACDRFCCACLKRQTITAKSTAVAQDRRATIRPKICTMDVNKYPEFTGTKSPNMSLISSAYLFAHLLKQHLANHFMMNHFMMTCLIQHIYLSWPHRRMEDSSKNTEK